MEVKVYSQVGKEVGKMNLDDGVFACEYNEPLIHQVIVAQRNNARQGTKCTLTRTEVRGGGKKPWRQKGTGNARQGSIRSPQWKGGGVVFAPKPRDFSQKINKNMKIGAICSALSAKIADGNFTVVDKIALAEGKTKQMKAVLDSLKIEKRVLLVIADADEKILRAAGNLQNVTVINASLINVYDVVANAKLVATKAAVEAIENAYKADDADKEAK